MTMSGIVEQVLKTTDVVGGGLLGKKTMEVEILRDALELAREKN